MTLKKSVPLHITGFFTPHFSNNPFSTGSTGAGIVITPGLKCICQFSDNKKRVEIFYNGVKRNIEPIKNLLKLVNFNKGALIKISSPIPLSFGYGASGAATLAVSLVIHRFLGKPDLEASKMAHIAEVRALTGLGDVLAIFSGRDLAVRIKPGAPGIGKVKSFKQAGNLRIITADIKKINTKKMLKSMSSEISRFGLKLLKKFIKNPEIENFFEYSQLFAEKMGFADEGFFKKLKPLKKYCLGFSVKKGVLFAAAEQDKLKNVIPVLKKFSPKIHIFKFGGGIKFSDCD